MRVNSLDIEANSVRVNNRPNGRRRRRARGAKQVEDQVVPQARPRTPAPAPKKKTVTFENFPGVITDKGPTTLCQLSDAAMNWVIRYTDPCGVHHRFSGPHRIPDGAVPFSAPAEVRFVDTLYRPNQTLAETDQTGKNGSWLYMLVPILRAVGIVLFNDESKEFNNEIMVAFCKAWANSVAGDRQAVVFPNWVKFHSSESLGNTYFTVLQSSALSKILPPSEAGDSPLLNQFRNSAYGLVMQHNTPTLFDQGTSVTAVFNCNSSFQEVSFDSLTGFNGVYFNWLPTNAFLEVRSPAGEQIDAMSDFAYSGGSFPSPVFESQVTVRSSSGQFSISVGDSCRYLNDNFTLVIENITKSTVFRLADLTLTSNQSVRMYFRFTEQPDDKTEIGSYNNRINVITLPPVRQDDVLQSDTSGVQTILKEYGGVYLVNEIFEPVFSMAEANAYSKIVFSTEGFNLDDAANPTLGWYDTMDVNFGIAVGNMQTIPYAAAPFTKIVRDDEQVPSTGSIVGLYATTTEPPDDVAMMIAKALKAKLPHGLPASANGFGTLFKLVSKVISKVPVAAAHAYNIAHTVSGVVDSVLAGINDMKDMQPGKPRMMRAY